MSIYININKIDLYIIYLLYYECKSDWYYLKKHEMHKLMWQNEQTLWDTRLPVTCCVKLSLNFESQSRL